MTAPTKADAAAADRLLKAAVRQAVVCIRERRAFPIRYVLGVDPAEGRADFALGRLLYLPEPEPDPVVAMLTAAGTAADLLLEARDA